MFITANKLAAVGRALKVVFKEAFNTKVSANIDDVITVTTSNSNEEEYGWIGEIGDMSAFVDEKQVTDLNEYDYRLKNNNYEKTIGINKNVFEDDNTGMLKARIAGLADVAKRHYIGVAFKAISDGEKELCFDGQPFFSKSHKFTKSAQEKAQTNLLTGAGVTLENITADFNKAEATMLSYRNDAGGQIYNGDEIPLAVICPVELKAVFNQLNVAEQINGTTNVLKGRFSKIITSPLLQGNSWYLADVTNSPVKALIKQMRTEPQLQSELEDEKAFHSNLKRRVSVEYRMGFGYGLWHKMIKVKNA